MVSFGQEVQDDRTDTIIGNRKCMYIYIYTVITNPERESILTYAKSHADIHIFKWISINESIDNPSLTRNLPHPTAVNSTKAQSLCTQICLSY